MADSSREISTVPTGVSSWVSGVAAVVADSVLVDRNFRDHPTQLVEGPDRACYVVEVKSDFRMTPPHVAPRWWVEVSAPGSYGLGPVVFREDQRSESRATRKAQSLRRQIRRGGFRASHGIAPLTR